MKQLSVLMCYNHQIVFNLAHPTRAVHHAIQVRNTKFTEAFWILQVTCTKTKRITTWGLASQYARLTWEHSSPKARHTWGLTTQKPRTSWKRTIIAKGTTYMWTLIAGAMSVLLFLFLFFLGFVRRRWRAGDAAACAAATTALPVLFHLLKRTNHISDCANNPS